MPVILSPTQAKILLSLAQYKFLTVAQMIDLGVSTKKSNMSVALKPLKESTRAFIGEMRFGSDPKKGKLSSFYYLKNKGKRAIVENGLLDEEEIKIPKGRSTLFSSDYHHRKITLDCEISCKKQGLSEGVEVVQFDRYFDKTGNQRRDNNLKAKTSITYGGGYIIADASCLLQRGETSKLFAIEIYNDKNTKRILLQLQKHIRGIEESSLCVHFGIEKAHRVLCVFTHKGIMDAVIERFDGGRISKYFLFKTVEECKSDFFRDWKSTDGKIASIF